MTKKNFDRLEVGGVYEDHSGIQVRILIEGEDGWFAGQKVDHPIYIGSFRATGEWSSGSGPSPQDLIKKIEPKRTFDVIIRERDDGSTYASLWFGGAASFYVSNIVARATITEGEGLD